MSEQKNVEDVPGEATASPDPTESGPPVGEGPALAVPETSPPEDTNLGSGPGS